MTDPIKAPTHEDAVYAAGLPRHRENTHGGCCTWETFLCSFADAWVKWFDAPPTEALWRAAERDWRSGNTGWEAAHNAQRRAKDRVGRLTRGEVTTPAARAAARTAIAAARRLEGEG